MKKDRSKELPKSLAKTRDLSKATSKEQMLLITGDPSLDFEIVKEGVKGIFEGEKWVYEWYKGQSPLIVHVIHSRYVNKHHVVTFTLKNISPHGVYVEDIALGDSMQIVAFQGQLGEPIKAGTFRDPLGKWVLDNTSLDPAPPFPNEPICPVFIPPLGSFSFNSAIKPSKNRKWAIISLILSPLSGKKVLKHQELFRLRDG